MLLVLIQQVVEDLLVQDRDALKVVTTARLKGDDFVDEPVGLVRQIGDVLLPLNFLLDVGGIVTDLEHDSVEGRLLLLLQPLYCQFNQVFGFLLR